MSTLDQRFRSSCTGSDNLSTTTVTYTRIYVDENGKLYVTYVDASNSNRLAIKTYNESTQTWGPLNGDVNNLYLSAETFTNGIGQFSSTPRSALAFSSNNTPYVIFGEGARLFSFVKRFNGSSWEVVGNDTGKYQLSIYNISGALVKSIGRGEAKAGRVVIHDLDAARLARGTYIIKLVTDTQVKIERLVIQ